MGGLICRPPPKNRDADLQIDRYVYSVFRVLHICTPSPECHAEALAVAQDYMAKEQGQTIFSGFVTAVVVVCGETASRERLRTEEAQEGGIIKSRLA